MTDACRTFVRALLSFAAGACCVLAHAQTEYAPPAGKGHGVLVLSGALGAPDYGAAARQVAEWGCDVMLFDANDFRGELGARVQDAIAGADA